MSGDQQWPTYDPADQRPSDEPTVDRASGPVPYGPPVGYQSPTVELTGRRPSGRWLARLVPSVVAIAVVGGIGLAVAAFDDDLRDAVDTLGEPLDDLGDDPATPPDLHSPDGFEELLAAVRERSGGTEVFETVLYPDYAVLDVPVDATSAREVGLYWDGSFSDFGGKGTSMGERLDLAKIDPTLVGRLVGRVKKLVDDPTSWYVIVRGRSTVFDDDGTRITAFASNEFNETASLATRLDGTLVRRSTS